MREIEIVVDGKRLAMVRYLKELADGWTECGYIIIPDTTVTDTNTNTHYYLVREQEQPADKDAPDAD